MTDKTTVELLKNHFDIALETPDGIKKLRELILSLAMQGKLVPQDPKDQSAGKLLKEIAAEKKVFLEEDKIRKIEVLPEIKSEMLPYELPTSWKWVRLGDIGETNIGLTYSPSDITTIGTPVLRSGNIQNGRLDFTDLVRVDCEIKESAFVNESDLLICARNGSRALVGKTALIAGLSEKMAFGAFMAVFRSRINFYLLYFINSPLFRKMIDEVNTMTINQITQNNLKSTIFPLPPLAEQKRIVAKIDQLMASCDKVEAERNERNNKRLKIHATAINKLLSATGKTEFNSSWNFITKNFSELYSVQENVEELKKAILQLAVMGKLVPQDPKDQPAGEMLIKIKEEKKRLLERGDLKSDKKEWAGSSNVPPYDLPSNWCWARLQDVFEISRGGSPRPAGDPRYFGGEIPWITVGEITKDTSKYLESTSTGLTKEGSNRSRFINPGDLLLTNSGATLGVPKISKIRGCMNDGVAVLRLFHKFNVNDFAYFFLSSQTSAFRNVNQGMGQPNLNTPIIAGWFFPLPPLAEQKRIVAKIDQLMSLCNTLEQEIKNSTDKQTAILNAVLARV
jgi:type I restriction enzyme S subunit